MAASKQKSKPKTWAAPVLPASHGVRVPCLDGCGTMVTKEQLRCRKCRKAGKFKVAKMAKKNRRISRRRDNG